MRLRPLGTICILSLVFAPVRLHAQDPHLAPSAPVDRPVQVDTDAEQARLDSAIAPYVAQARATYPAARRRYLAGLPPQESFFVTVHLKDSSGRRETVFLVVDSLARDSVYGRIWNQIHSVHGYRLKDSYGTAEADILDWLITKPDGSEEGNFVGKFIDTYRP